jgi:hypothetical protein
MAKSNVLNSLRVAEAAALRIVERGQRELNGIRVAIAAVAGSLSASTRGRGARAATAVGAATRKRSRMSAAARKAVSLRMKKYWAARRAGAKK